LAQLLGRAITFSVPSFFAALIKAFLPPPALADFAVDQLNDFGDAFDANAAPVASAAVAQTATATSSERLALLDRRLFTTPSW